MQSNSKNLDSAYDNLLKAVDEEYKTAALGLSVEILETDSPHSEYIKSVAVCIATKDEQSFKDRLEDPLFLFYKNAIATILLLSAKLDFLDIFLNKLVSSNLKIDINASAETEDGIKFDKYTIFMLALKSNFFDACSKLLEYCEEFPKLDKRFLTTRYIVQPGISIGGYLVDQGQYDILKKIILNTTQSVDLDDQLADGRKVYQKLIEDKQYSICSTNNIVNDKSLRELIDNDINNEVNLCQVALEIPPKKKTPNARPVKFTIGALLIECNLDIYKDVLLRRKIVDLNEEFIPQTSSTFTQVSQAYFLAYENQFSILEEALAFHKEQINFNYRPNSTQKTDVQSFGALLKERNPNLLDKIQTFNKKIQEQQKQAFIKETPDALLEKSLKDFLMEVFTKVTIETAEKSNKKIILEDTKANISKFSSICKNIREFGHFPKKHLEPQGPNATYTITGKLTTLKSSLVDNPKIKEQITKICVKTKKEEITTVTPNTLNPIVIPKKNLELSEMERQTWISDLKSITEGFYDTLKWSDDNKQIIMTLKANEDFINYKLASNNYVIGREIRDNEILSRLKNYLREKNLAKVEEDKNQLIITPEDKNALIPELKKIIVGFLSKIQPTKATKTTSLFLSDNILKKAEIKNISKDGIYAPQKALTIEDARLMFSNITKNVFGEEQKYVFLEIDATKKKKSKTLHLCFNLDGHRVIGPKSENKQIDADALFKMITKAISASLQRKISANVKEEKGKINSNKVCITLTQEDFDSISGKMPEIQKEFEALFALAITNSKEEVKEDLTPTIILPKKPDDNNNNNNNETKIKKSIVGLTSVELANLIEHINQLNKIMYDEKSPNACVHYHCYLFNAMQVFIILSNGCLNKDDGKLFFQIRTIVRHAFDTITWKDFYQKFNPVLEFLRKLAAGEINKEEYIANNFFAKDNKTLFDISDIVPVFQAFQKPYQPALDSKSLGQNVSGDIKSYETHLTNLNTALGNDVRTMQEARFMVYIMLSELNPTTTYAERSFANTAAHRDSYEKTENFYGRLNGKIIEQNQAKQGMRN